LALLEDKLIAVPTICFLADNSHTDQLFASAISHIDISNLLKNSNLVNFHLARIICDEVLADVKHFRITNAFLDRLLLQKALGEFVF
jgi:hypothetical protein